MAKKTSTTQDQDVLLVTAEGFAEMQSELEECRKLKDVIANEIDEARKLGDTSENEPYHSAMQRKEMNDTRFDELEYLITIAQIVRNQSNTVVGIGSTVELERADNATTKTVMLVGKQAAQESDPLTGKISIDSPLGAALNGKTLNAVVKLQLPIGEVVYKIIKIQ